MIEDIRRSGSRLPAFDVLRFVAMFMVIVWHLLDLNLTKHPDAVSYTANFILGCNMPIFFLISGYFGRRMVETHDFKKWFCRLAMYFAPMLVFSILNGTVYSLLIERTGVAAIPVRAIKCFLFGGWFFYALALCEGLTMFIQSIKSKLGVSIIVSMIFVYLGLLALPVNIWYVNRVLDMLPYFWFGMYMMTHILCAKRKYLLPSLFILIAYMALCIFEGNIRTNGLGFYWERITLCNSSFRDYVLAIGRFVIGTLTSVSMVILFDRLIQRYHFLSKLACLGTTTIGVYFMHGLILRLFFHNWDPPFWMIVPIAAVIYLVCHSIVNFSRCYKTIDVAIWGSARMLGRGER